MITQEQIDRDRRVDEMINSKFKGVAFEVPGVCTVKWEPADWEKWINNHKAI